MLFVWEQGGRILDDTVIPKPLATAMESWAWVYSRQDRQPVDGCSLVPWVWTTGTLRSPHSAYGFGVKAALHRMPWPESD